MNPGVVPWEIRLEKGSDFWESLITVKDAAGEPVPYLTTELTIYPLGKDPIVWNPANGRLSIPEDGKFLFDVSKEEIDTYDWERADYKWSVTYTNAKVDGNWMEGVVIVDAH